jgi:Macro domain
MEKGISLTQTDITRLATDAIVNAANTSLMGGSGVDGAIHRAGGAAILEACIAIRNRQGGCAVGEAVITTRGAITRQVGYTYRWTCLEWRQQKRTGFAGQSLWQLFCPCGGKQSSKHCFSQYQHGYLSLSQTEGCGNSHCSSQAFFERWYTTGSHCICMF